MASNDRMIVPFVCTECGAPLKRKKQACEFCRVEWEMVKRYNGPELTKNNLSGAWTTVTNNGSTALMYNEISTESPYYHGY
jgi:hypothetical protein